MEFWAQRTVSPLDGRIGWTVVDDDYVEHIQAGIWLRALVDAQGRSVGTARTYAGRLALFLTWATAAAVDAAAPTVDELASFARWLERTPSRKHRPGGQRRRAADPKVVSFTPRRARRPRSRASSPRWSSSCASVPAGTGAIRRLPTG